jgi:F-type H+-transporting ATPase subunit b
MEVVENVALISINATLLVQLGSFLIFMVLFNRIMIKPLRKVMTERDQYMVHAREEVSGINHSYKEISQQIVDQEAHARSSAIQIREEIETSGKVSANDVVSKTKEEIRQLRTAAQKETEVRISAAREQVTVEAEGLAEEMIAALLGRKRSAL